MKTPAPDADAGATIRMPPMARGSGLLPASLAAAYDALAERYDAEERRLAARRPVDLGLLFSFAKVVSAQSGPVLDVGCGPGHAAAHLGELGLVVHGVDVSAHMVALARRNAPRATFAAESFEHSEVTPGSLVGALALGAFVHASDEDRAASLSKLAAAIAPGGALLWQWFTCAPGLAPGSSYPLEQWLGVRVGLELQLLSIRAAATELTRAGFDVLAATQREALPDELPLRRGFALAIRR